MKKVKLFLKKYWWLVLLIVLAGGYYWTNSDGDLFEGKEDLDYLTSSYYDYGYDDDYYYAEAESVRAYDVGAGFAYEYMDESGSYDQKVMKSGSLTLHVDDVQEVAEEMTDYVTGLGGIVTSSSINRGDSSYYGYLTVRVPVESFDEALLALKEMSLYVDYEYVYADDITETYMDLEARLNNLMVEEAAYLDLMEMTGSVTEILEVTSALANVRYEIESTESSLSYYDARVDYSTIDLSLSEDDSVSAVTETWRPIGTVMDAFSDWIVFLQDGADKVIYGAIYLWPLALIVLVVWLVRRRKK
jgi:hypothetical protein